MVITSKISLKTLGNADTHDITEAVVRAVTESGLTSGTVTVFCPGSTSGITTIEYEEGAEGDPGRLRGDEDATVAFLRELAERCGGDWV